MLTATGTGGSKTSLFPISVEAAHPLLPVTRIIPSHRIARAEIKCHFALRKRFASNGAVGCRAECHGRQKDLEAIRDWQRVGRVTWEVNRGTTAETMTYASPSDVRIESQGQDTTVDFSDGASVDLVS